MRAQRMHVRIRRVVLDPSPHSGLRSDTLASAIETELLPWASGKAIDAAALASRSTPEKRLAGAVAGAVTDRLDTTPNDPGPRATGGRNG
jgi:hypothetical protein